MVRRIRTKCNVTAVEITHLLSIDELASRLVATRPHAVSAASALAAATTGSTPSRGRTTNRVVACAQRDELLRKAWSMDDHVTMKMLGGASQMVRRIRTINVSGTST